MHILPRNTYGNIGNDWVANDRLSTYLGTSGTFVSNGQDHW